MSTLPEPGFNVTEEPWLLDAACRGKPTSWFFPERGQSTAPARATCPGCPVKDECLEYALRTGQRSGIWGGTSAAERKAIRRAMRREAA